MLIRNDIVVAFTHPSGVNLSYHKDADVDESLPFRLREWKGYSVRMYRTDRLSIAYSDVFIASVDNKGLTVAVLDDEGEVVNEYVYVPFKKIAKLEVL